MQISEFQPEQSRFLIDILVNEPWEFHSGRPLTEKEAHYRQCRPTQDNVKADTVGYGILRNDWRNKTITQVDWEG